MSPVPPPPSHPPAWRHRPAGVSNLLTAGAGVGFTGSYIFSQTLFSMRMGVDSPLMGAIVAGGRPGGPAALVARRGGLGASAPPWCPTTALCC